MARRGSRFHWYVWRSPVCRRQGGLQTGAVLFFRDAGLRKHGVLKSTATTATVGPLPQNLFGNAYFSGIAGYTQHMRTKTSVSQEDYLKAIWELLEERQPPISARLAEELSVTPPAVTAALKRLRRDDLVSVARNGHIDLTRKGRAVAEHMALRHQLAEMLLTVQSP